MSVAATGRAGLADQARRAAAGEDFELGEMPLANLRLPPPVREGALAFAETLRIARQQDRGGSRGTTASATDLALVEAAAIDLLTLTHQLAGRPRSPDLLRCLLALGGMLDALVTVYGASRKEAA